MGKKYLLYIHDSRFNDEKEKSKLVNKLLAEHYGGPVVVFSTNVRKTLVNALTKESPKPSSPAVGGELRRATWPNEKKCKVHGIPLDWRGKCLQKGCKYA